MLRCFLTSHRMLWLVINRKKIIIIPKLLLFQTNVVEMEIHIDPKHHRHFLARRGEVANKISSDCGGVELNFPRMASKSSLVVLKGPKECIEAAKSQVEAIVADLV